MLRKITGIFGIIVIIISFLISAYSYIDLKYAKALDVKRNTVNIKINQVQSNIRWYQDQMIYIMSKHNVRDSNKLPLDAFNNYRHYKIQKNTLEKELTALIHLIGK